MDETIHAYTAGIIDGEGTISIVRNKPHRNNKSPTYDPKVFVTNTNLEALMFLKKIYGGSLTKMTRVKKVWTTCYRWSIGAKEVGTFLKSIVPYLIIKKVQGLLLLEFLEARTLVRYPRGSFESKDELPLREAYFQRMWKLNHSD